MKDKRDPAFSRRDLIAAAAATQAAALLNADPAGAQGRRTAAPEPAPGQGKVYSVTAAGAAGDGRRDDTKAFQTAIDRAAAAGGGVAYIPPGTYRVRGGIEPKAGVTVAGAGMDATILRYDEKAGVSCFARSRDKPEIAYVAFRDFTVVGPWKNRPGHQDLRAFVIGAVHNLRFDHVGCRYIRGMSLTCQDCRDVEIAGCRIEYSARDGISAHQSENVRIQGCTIRHCGDDAIAAHVGPRADSPVTSGIVVTGCIIEDTLGVKILGAKAVSISGNVLRRCKGYGLWVGIYDGVYKEGFTSSHSVTITGNVILDVMNLTAFGGGRLHSYMRIGSYRPSRGGNRARAAPGRPDSGGRFVRPWDGPYLYSEGLGRDTVHAGGYLWAISGNVCARSLPPAARYSDWGYGKAFAAGGWRNPRITERVLRGDGIVMVESLRRAVIANNMICTGGHGVLFAGARRDHTFESIEISGNHIACTLTNGVSSTLRTDRQLSVRVVNNSFDGDPYHEHPARRPNGGWAGDPGGGPAALNAAHMKGVEFSGNTVRNVYRAVNTSPGSVVHVAYANTLRCQPHAVGDSRDNLGIGDIPHAGRQFTYLIEDADPRRSGYGAVRNSNVLGAASQPRSGRYVQGHFVEKVNPVPDGNGRILTGWLRRTTGTGHTSGVDWVAVWASASTWKAE